MARDSNGNYTLPAGNPVVTETLITSIWANTTMSDVGGEMTDSLSRSGKGNMLAPLRIIDADLPTPGLAFQNEPTSGFLRVGVGDLRLRALGTDVAGFAQAKFSTYVNSDINGTLTVNGVMSATGRATFPSVAVTSTGELGTDKGMVDFSAPELRLRSINTGASPASNIGFYTTNTGGTTIRALQLDFNQRMIALPTYSVTVGATNRDLHIDNTGLIGYVTSSKRYKKHIRPLKNSDFVSKLCPVEYDREDGTHEIGLLAEDVEAVAPQYVWHDEQGRPDGVDYKGLIVPILARLQQLEAKLS